MLWSLFLINPEGQLQLYLKETPTQVFSCKICDIFKNAYFKEHLFSVCFPLYRNDPIKRPAFFKRPPRISAQEISSMFNKRPALLSPHPIKGGA